MAHVEGGEVTDPQPASSCTQTPIAEEATVVTDHEFCDYVPVDPAALDAAAYALHRDGYDEGDYIPEEADPEDFERAEVVLQGLRAAGFDVIRRD